MDAMGRTTIRDLAEAAEVSVSTVNRLIGSHGSVRAATMPRVPDAAEDIGFYGLGAFQHRMTLKESR